MKNKIKIAVDAMGGDRSPKKILDGIRISLKKSKDIFFYIYGKKDIIEKNLLTNDVIKEFSEIIHTDDLILDNDSPLAALKRGKNSSMWKCIESQKNKVADISLSAGNTGSLLVMSKLILKTIDGINKPALAGLWPNTKGMNIVLDLGANIECDEKNLVDFCNMGSALYKDV